MKQRWLTPERARRLREEIDAGGPGIARVWTPEREKKAREGLAVIISEAVRPESWRESPPPAPESPGQE